MAHELPVPDSTLKSTLNPTSRSPWERLRENWTQQLSSVYRAGLLTWHSFCPYCQVVFTQLKGAFYTSWCKKQQKEQSKWYVSPAILRLSRDLHAEERVTWWQAKGHKQQNFSLLLFLFYSDIIFNSEDQIKNNHQDKFKLPWKYYILPLNLQSAGFIVGT